jgi:hypothetical protein
MSDTTTSTCPLCTPWTLRQRSNKELKYFLGVGPNIQLLVECKRYCVQSDLEENNIDEISYKSVFKKDPENQQQMK